MLFRKKSKEEKVLEEIKAKKAQMDKLKEEIVQMGKLVLKDGKLQRVEDQPVQAPAPVPVQQAPHEFDQQVERVAAVMPQPRQQQRPPQGRSMPAEYVAQAPQEDPEMNIVYEAPRPEVMPQQQYRQQPQYVPQQQPQYVPQQQPQYAMPEEPPVTVIIEMITGTVIQIVVPREKFESFLSEMNEAIDSQSSFPLGNQVINGRNVVVYTYQ